MLSLSANMNLDFYFLKYSSVFNDQDPFSSDPFCPILGYVDQFIHIHMET